MQAVYESVQRSTKYVAFEFGVHSYQPYPVATVERRGFGDCKDKAAMIVALLRAVGVPAEFAMVRTRSAGDVARQAYSVQLFNHAVAYVPELNLYLDGTAEYAALGELPPDDQGATGDDGGRRRQGNPAHGAVFFAGVQPRNAKLFQEEHERQNFGELCSKKWIKLALDRPKSIGQVQRQCPKQLHWRTGQTPVDAVP